MGEVYKAKDTRLDRTVAIKVLPAHLSDNARLKERFEREALVLGPETAEPAPIYYIDKRAAVLCSLSSTVARPA